MSNTELLELAERCEKATGPDRELDAAICKALGWRTWERRYGKPWEAQNVERGWFKMPAYTASIDAAMTLVPEGSGILLDRYWLREGAAWSAKISTGGVPENPARQFWGEDTKTAALALCAAALKARASQ